MLPRFSPRLTAKLGENLIFAILLWKQLSSRTECRRSAAAGLHSGWNAEQFHTSGYILISRRLCFTDCGVWREVQHAQQWELFIQLIILPPIPAPPSSSSIPISQFPIQFPWTDLRGEAGTWRRSHRCLSVQSVPSVVWSDGSAKGILLTIQKADNRSTTGNAIAVDIKSFLHITGQLPFFVSDGIALKTSRKRARTSHLVNTFPPFLNLPLASFFHIPSWGTHTGGFLYEPTLFNQAFSGWSAPAHHFLRRWFQALFYFLHTASNPGKKSHWWSIIVL